MHKHHKKQIIKQVIFATIGLLIFAALCIRLHNLYVTLAANKPNSVHITEILLDLLVLGLVLVVMIAGYFASKLVLYNQNKLKKRIVLAFSIGTALPTIIMAIFSTYFFNFGIQAWFDKKISAVLEQSVEVGESYVEEHILQLKNTAISVADDLNSMYYDLIQNPELFTKVINAQAELRSFDEAIVFQKDINAILAQTALSFSLAFINIPYYLIERADRGEVLQLESAPTKVRILIKLKEYTDTYLLIGRLVDATIIDHIDQANGAAHEYNILKQKIFAIQIKFSIVFILVGLILVTAAIIWGHRFAERMVKPIKELVIASEKVKNGDFTTQVPIANLQKDEIKILSTSFNRMIDQINRQQKELVIAQRALAWSDVARRVAHEIKNPLTPIQLSTERLVKKFTHEVSDPILFQKYTSNILRNSDDIKKIVSEFVEFAKLPSLNFARCEIISLMNDIVESRRLINDSVHYKFSTNKPQYILACDIAQINRVMVNILLNAEEALYSSQKSSKQIRVSLNASDRYFHIIIEDNGPGFSDKLLHTAKDVYVTTKVKGTGLGLAIVDRIIHDHFGELKIGNNSLGGARIEILIDAIGLNSKFNLAQTNIEQS